jgi:hypothetical protein
MRYVYDDEKINDVTENDIFQYSSIKIKNWAQQQMNCNQIEFLNPDIDIDNEDF